MPPLSIDILRNAALRYRTTPAILRSPCRHATTVRKRKNVARFLHEQGLSMFRIAKLLDRNESTVRRYVDPNYAARRDAKMLAKYYAGRS